MNIKSLFGSRKKFTCPYCFRQYDLNEVLYVCPECNKITKPSSFEHNPIKCRTSGCEGYAVVRKCPHCNNIIPQSILESDNLPFSIVGASGSGKTNYIAVMLRELGRSSGLKISLTPSDNNTRDIQAGRIHSIYDLHVPAALTEEGSNTPQIWCIKNLTKRAGDTVPSYTFTVYDGAGRDYENKIDPSSTVCRYIMNSKAVMILLDPLMFKSDTSLYVVNKLAEYIKSSFGINTNQLLNIPAAIVITKFDLLMNNNYFASNSIVKSPSLAVNKGKIKGKINSSEFLQVDREIRDWLKLTGEGRIIDSVSSHFKEYLFFGVSSFGGAPDSSQHLGGIHPHRVLDPMMWLLMKSGFID